MRRCAKGRYVVFKGPRTFKKKAKQIRLDRRRNDRENQDDLVLGRRLNINRSCKSRNFELCFVNGLERMLIKRNDANDDWVLTCLGRRVARQANQYKQLTIKAPSWEPSNSNQSRFLANGQCWQCVSNAAIIELLPHFAAHIEEINISSYKFDNKHASFFGSVLNKFPKLKTLRVASTTVPAMTFDCFLQRIKKNKTIKVLDIGNNRMSLVGVDHLNEMMMTGTLRRINLHLSWLDDTQAQ
jgi:hypothetical protein